eukprot:6486117-Prymnesium_polylepis.1
MERERAEGAAASERERRESGREKARLVQLTVSAQEFALSLMVERNSGEAANPRAAAASHAGDGAADGGATGSGAA